jgi:glycosyltransferase involved in cell wall biosynthesis
MALAGEMLARALRELEQPVVAVAPPLRSIARRLPGLDARTALNADRLLTRFGFYPLRASGARLQADGFHIVDHTYAQLVHALPAARTGVYCHDLDAFSCLLEPARDPRPLWFRALAQATLLGLRRAALVFHSTQAVREQLLAHRLVDERRLVHAPLGVAPEFFSPPGPPPEKLRALDGRRFVLHVGSAAPRKRLDLVFHAFAQATRGEPEVLLVQQGAQLGVSQWAQLEQLGIAARLVQPPPLERTELAWLYQRSEAVLLPSDREGFGLPVVEALACGARVIASDLPALREVGGSAVRFCPPGDRQAFAQALAEVLQTAETAQDRAAARAQAARFSWSTHARIIRDAYLRL